MPFIVSDPERFIVPKENQKSWPNFFIVGAARAGTTSLYSYLAQHPQIFVSSLKEPHFFSGVEPRPEERHLIKCVTREPEYLALFYGGDAFLARGEASTSYLWSEKAPVLIKQHIPEARIIVLLRDPVERAYSHYLLDIREGRLRRPFFQALMEDFESSSKGWFTSNLYVELGFYYQQVERYYRVFQPNNILILMFQDLINDPSQVLFQVTSFLGVDPKYVPYIDTESAHNLYAAPRNQLAQRMLFWGRRPILRLPRAIYKRMAPKTLQGFFRKRVLRKRSSKPTMDMQARLFLQGIYEPNVQALEHLLQRDLSILRISWR
jgi:hypothetical protein